MTRISLPKGKTAILLMDCQNDIVDEKGKLNAPTQGALVRMIMENRVLETIAKLATAGRASYVPIVYVRHAFRPDFADMPPNQPGLQFLQHVQALQEGTWGTQIHAAVTPHSEDFIVTKTRPNAFFASSLEGVLRAREITHLVLTGVSTDGVVAHTGNHGADLGFYIFIPEDCCTSMSTDQHRATLGAMQSIGTICNADDVIAAIA